MPFELRRPAGISSAFRGVVLIAVVGALAAVAAAPPLRLERAAPCLAASHRAGSRSFADPCPVQRPALRPRNTLRGAACSTVRRTGRARINTSRSPAAGAARSSSRVAQLVHAVDRSAIRASRSRSSWTSANPESCGPSTRSRSPCATKDQSELHVENDACTGEQDTQRMRDAVSRRRQQNTELGTCSQQQEGPPRGRKPVGAQTAHRPWAHRSPPGSRGKRVHCGVCPTDTMADYPRSVDRNRSLRSRDPRFQTTAQ